MLTFNKLYESYAQDVFRFAMWLSGSRCMADDITSETFIRAWTHFQPIRTETLKAYLFTIARNYYLGQMRKEKRIADLDDWVPDPVLLPEARVELLDEIKQVQTFLQTLPECDRSAFILRVQHNIPYAEIARIMEISESAAKVKIHRARKKLTLNRISSED